MAELKFLKGAYSAYTAKTSYDENSFYVTMEPVGEKTMYALWLGKELIASGNTVAALEAEISRAKVAEQALADRIAKFEGEGEGSVKDQIAKLEEALEQKIADEKDAREEAVSALTQDIVDVNADLDTEEAARIAADEVLSGAIDDNAAAIEKLNGDAETVGSVAKAVADAKSELLGDAAADYNTLGKLEDKIQAVEAAAKSYSIAVASVADENVKEAYKLVDEDGVQVGETIKIYKDSALQSVVLSGQQLVFTYILASGQTEVVGVDVSNFLAESEFADGLQVVDHVVSVKIAEGSEAFLTVDANGIKLSGVQDAIDDAVEAEKERAEGKEGELAKAIEDEAKTRGEEITRVEGLISAEETRAKAEEGKLAQAIADEAARAEGKEGELAKAIEDEATARENADKALSNRIAAFEGGENSVAAQIEAAKTELNNAITAEATTRENADTQLNTAITTEKNRAEGKEAELAQAIATEKTDRETAVKTEKERAEGKEAELAKAIEDEAKRADEAEKANAKAIADEKDRAEAEELRLNNAITAETSARENADKAINDKIGAVTEGKTVVEMINDAKAAATAAHTKVAKDGEAAHITLTSTTDEAGAVTYTIGESDIASKSVMESEFSRVDGRINVLLSGGSLNDTLESIKEIDEYLKAHEGEAGDMLAAIQANATAISAETSAREAAVKGEKERAEAAEAFLSGAIDTEVAERKAAVSAETDARVAADNVLSGKIDTEITNREAADNVLSGAIDTEVTERKAAVSAVAADLAAEVSRATSAETALSDRIAAFEGTGEGSVAKQIEAAKTELNNAISAEATTRETADNALSDRLDAIEAVTVTGKDAIVVSASGATENKEVSLKLAENQVDAAGAGVKLTQDGNGLKATMEWGTF